jgi:hypothetical protein
MSKRQNEASALLESMQVDSFGDGIRPGISCYTACMLSSMQSENWGEVLRLNDVMLDEGLSQSTNTFHAVILAAIRLGNHEDVIGVMEKAIRSETPIDKDVYRVCIKELLPDFQSEGDVDKMMLELRQMGERNPQIKADALEVAKYIRIASVAGHQNASLRRERTVQNDRDRLWREALSKTIQLSKTIDS